MHLHCERVLIHALLILTFTLSHLNKYPKRTDLKTPTKADTYRNAVFVQVCKRVNTYTFALLRPCSHCHRDSSTRALKMKKFSNENSYTNINGFVNRLKCYRLESAHKVKRTHVNAAFVCLLCSFSWIVLLLGI